MKKITIVIFLLLTCSIFGQVRYDSVSVANGTKVTGTMISPYLGMVPGGINIDAGIADSVYLEGSYDADKWFVINYNGSVYYAVGDSTKKMGITFKANAMINPYPFYRATINTAVASDTMFYYTWVKLFR